MTTPNGLVVANTVSVDPGPTPTTLLTQMPAGTQILNLDTANSIWVSDNQSVTPGVGYEIGPQGSCTWQYDGHPAYACVDTGVATAVNVTFGNSVSDVQNPTFVAEALAILGIPNVLLQENVVSGVQVGSGNASPTYDVHKYASLVVVLGISISSDPTLMGYQWFDEKGSQCGAGEILIPANTFIGPPYQIPVQGVSINWINNGNSAITLYMDGSNRPVAAGRAQMLDDQLGNQIFTAIAGTSGQHTLGILQVPQSGRLTCAFVMNGVIGYFTVVDAVGVALIVCDSAEGHNVPGTGSNVVYKTLYLGPSWYTLVFNQTTATAAAAAQLICSG